jgi:hypothetical protein
MLNMRYYKHKMTILRSTKQLILRILHKEEWLPGAAGDFSDVLRSVNLLCLRVFFIIAVSFVSVVLFANDENADGESEPEPEFDIEEMRRRILGEAPEEFMGFSLGDSNVSLLLNGSWSGTLQGNAGFSNTPLGMGFASPETPLLFTQQADLTMALWINNRWFVETSFQEDSDMNTYRAGYQGQQGEFVQYAGIGNTGLAFPVFPYLDLGGDSPSSFGFYGRFGVNDFNFHALLRYDAASREEKVFIGSRERTFTYVQPQNPVRGMSFVLPDTNIDSQIIVYIEDDNGTLRDLNGRRWRLALQNEYAAGRVHGLLDLSIRTNGMIAVSYTKGAQTRPWNMSMDEFLSDVQRWFGFSLENYLQSGNEVVIGGVTALVIRQPGTFSPFERLNRYEMPSSTSEQAAVVRLSSGAAINAFELVPLDSAWTAGVPLYAPSVSQRGFYELLPAGSSFSVREPEMRWPLAREFPEVYLPGSGVFSGDIVLRFTNFSNTNAFLIGTDVVSGSIQVWRSGIQDTNFSYSLSTGEVILNSPVGASEIIRITYLKRSEETQLGSIAAGIGAVYGRNTSPFSAEAALGIRWNLTEGDSFTEEGLSSPGSLGISIRTSWNFDNLKAHINTGLALDRKDTTGLYRVAGMEGNEIILPLPAESSFVSNPPISLLVTGLDISNRARLIYRNYINTTVLGSNLMPINWGGAVVVTSLDRPYPARDPQLGETQVLAAEFILNDTEVWTGFQIPVIADSVIISGAGEIEIPFRLYDFNNPQANLKLIIQIGSLSAKDFAYNENLNLIWEQQIFHGNGQDIDSSLRIARFTIREEDRVKLTDARYMRLIAVYEGFGDEISGRVLIAPPIIRGTSFRAITASQGEDGRLSVNGVTDFSTFNNRVTAIETIETGTNTLQTVFPDLLNRLHRLENTQRVMKINWENMEEGISAGIDGRVGRIPLADYRQLSFFVKVPQMQDGTLSFIIAPGPHELSQRILETHIPLRAFRAGQWSKVTIRYQGNDTGITVNGENVQGASFNYNPAANRENTFSNIQGQSGYIALFVNPQEMPLQDGTIFVDEIILEDSGLVYRVNAGASIQYKRLGTLLAIGAAPLLADLTLSSTVESEFRGDPSFNNSQEEPTAGSVVNRTALQVSVFGIQVSGNVAFTAGKETFLWRADHGVSHRFGPLFIRETFYASAADNSAGHTLHADLSSIRFMPGFNMRLNSSANYEYSSLERRWDFGIGYRPNNNFIPSIAISSNALWTTRDEHINEDEQYGGLWIRTLEHMIPDSGSNADVRRAMAQIVLSQGTRPVGAVLTVQGNTNASKPGNLTRLENSAFLDIPVVFDRSQVNFRIGRTNRAHFLFFAEDAVEDTKKLFETINDSIPLWKLVPGYSLFAPEVNEVMDKALHDSSSFEYFQYMGFMDHLSLRIFLPSTYNLTSLFVPSRIGLRMERNLEQKLDTRSDILNLSGSLGFSAINMFGNLGHFPLFGFYETDEFNHVIETAVMCPRDEEIAWRIQSTATAGFRGQSGGILNFVNTLTVRSTGAWLESMSVDWTMPTKNSLLSIFYGHIVNAALAQSVWLGFSALLNSDFEQLRKESLELILENTDNNFRWTLILGHEAIVRIVGRLNLSAFTKFRLNEDVRTNVFTFDVLLGTSLRILF